MKDSISRFILVLCMSLMSLGVNSMAVSEVVLISHLNQLLDARVRILAASEDEISSLNVILTENSDEILNRSSSGLTYEIINNDQGAYISISSRDVIKEPIVDFTLELSWAEGHLIRDYTLIVDPQ
jgi:pilus assembly protein FimV